MIPIQYPSLPSGVDYEGIMGATQRGYDQGRQWKNERQAPEMLARLYGLNLPQQKPGLAERFSDGLANIFGGGKQGNKPQMLSDLGDKFDTSPPQGSIQRAPLPAPTDPATTRVEQAFAAQGQGSGLPSIGEMRQYIAQAAQSRGIDPAVAIRVAQSEGLTPNTWQSNVTKNGKREPSYGPFQMLVGGGDTGFPEGMGNSFAQQTGLDPTDPANWKKMTDFALDTASKQGWGQWYGAKAAGIGAMQGINGTGPSEGAPAQVADASGTFMPQKLGGMPQGAIPSLPDGETMRKLFANPVTRPYAIEAARARLTAMQGQADPMKRLEYEKALLEVQNLRNPQEKPTDDMREYNFAKSQGFDGSFVDFQLAQKKAGATSVNVNAGDKAWDQESAKLFAKRYDDITGAAGNAQTMLGMYDLAEQALTSGVRTGFGAEAELNLRQLGASMGIDTDPEKLAGGELIRSIQNRMALLMRSPDGGMGMPGALSDRDIKFLKDAQIGLDRSPEGNRKMLNAYRAMENRKIELSQLADQYVQDNGKLDVGFNKAVREFAQANPLFPEKPTGSGATRGAGGATGRQRARNPQTGEMLEWDGSQWRPVQ